MIVRLLSISAALPVLAAGVFGLAANLAPGLGLDAALEPFVRQGLQLIAGAGGHVDTVRGIAETVVDFISVVFIYNSST